MKAIHPKNLPSKPPVMLSAVVWLLLDRLQPPGWVDGVAYTILALLWITYFVILCKEEHTDIFKR